MGARRRSRFILACSGLAVALVVSGAPAASSAASAAPNSVGATAALSAPDDLTDGEPSAEAEALAEAAETGRRVEVAEARTETETLVANPSGTLTLRVAGEPVRTENAAGELVDIDTDLEPAGGDLVTKATPNEVVLSGEGTGSETGAEVLARVSDPETDVSVGLGFEGRLADPVVDGSVATYAQDEQSSVRVTTGQDGFAAHVLLAEPPATATTPENETNDDTTPGVAEGLGPVYRFPLTVSGATARLVGGGLEFVDPAGEVVGSSSALRMWDSQTDEFGDPSNIAEVEATLVGPVDAQVLELRPSMDFLAGEDTLYPVTIDPDITLGPIMATYITTESPDQGFTGAYNLRVGSDNGIDKYRSFVDFETESLAGQTVTDADLRLYQYAAGTCDSRKMLARMARTTWQEGSGAALRSWSRRAYPVDDESRFTTSASFNRSAASGPLPGCGTPGWESIDVTGQISSWAGMVSERYGIFLTTPTDRELNPNFEKRFCSDDRNTTGSGRCQSSDVKPELRLTYTPYIGDQGWYSTSEHKLGERDTLKINHQTGNAYLAANDVQVSSLGMNLSVGRRYNSRAETAGQFGPKWTMSGGPDVWLEKIDQWRYVYHTPDGAELGPFVRKADTSGDSDYRKFFTPAGGLGADLKDENDGTFTLTFHSSQKKYVFTQMGSGGDLYQTKQKDRSENTTTFDYVPGTQRLDSVTDTAGRTYDFGYGTGAEADLVTTITDDNGPTTRTWAYDYNADGRLSSYTDPEGDVTTYDWAPATGTPGEVISTITDPVNDSGQAPTTTLDTDNAQTVKATYAGATSGENSVYVFEYHIDNEGNDKSQECASVAGTDRSARVQSLDPTAFTVYCFKERENGSLTESANNMSTTVVDGKGQKRSASYSPDNQPEVMSDSDGAETVNEYGDPGQERGDQLQNSTQPDDDNNSGASTVYTYAENASFDGHNYSPISVKDGNGDCTAYSYDPKGRLTDTWIGRDPGTNDRCDGASGGQHYQAKYNPDGTVDWMQDPNDTSTTRTQFEYWNSNDTGFVAGTKGQVKTMRRPGGSCASGTARKLCTAYTYDALARTLSQTDGAGNLTRYSYDVMDRTTESLSNGASTCQPASGECITYDYDTAGNMTQRTDAQGVTDFRFDPMNRRISQDTPDGVQVAYTYNRTSRMTRLEQTVPGQPTDAVDYEYDQAGQVSGVTDASGTIGILYDSNQRLKTTTFPTNGPVASIDRSYTSAGKALKINVRTGNTTNDQMTNYDYTWNKDGVSTNQLQTMKVSQSPAPITYDAKYGYNDRGQLTSDTRTNGGGPSFDYTYDNAGNLATAKKGAATTHYGYDRANQLCWTGPSDGPGVVDTCPTTAPGSSTVVTRDAAGNSEGDPDHPIDYNPRNQATDIDGQTQDYYDQGNDLRLRAGTTALVNTTTGITARTTNAGTTNAETTFFTRMPDGRLLSMRGPDGTFYYVTDHHKTVLGLIDTDGERAGTYRYDPYGKPTLVEGSPAEQANPFRWIGGYQNNTDQPGGYYKFGARFYNPDTGAFTQPDPEMGNLGEPLRLNAYLYSAGDPINNTDASGRFWEEAVEFAGKASDAYDAYSFVSDVQDGAWEAATGTAVGWGVSTAGAAACTAAIVGAPVVGAIGCAVYFGAVGYAAGYGTEAALNEGF